MKPSAQDVLDCLLQGGWWTAIELIEVSHRTDATRRMRELRQMPEYQIEKRRRYGLNGKPLASWEYRLIPHIAAYPQQETLPIAVSVSPGRDAYGPD